MTAAVSQNNHEWTGTHTYKSPHADDELMLITIIMLSVISEENDNVISYDDLLVARCSNFPVPLSYIMDMDAHPMTVHLTTRVEMDNLLKNNTCKSCYNSHISYMRILQGHLKWEVIVFHGILPLHTSLIQPG